MKNTTKITTILVFLTISACAIVEESEPAAGERINRSVTGPMYTKGLVQEDSIQRIIAYQTDKTLLLLHQIKERDGVLVLDLTEAEIRELNIPESLVNDVLEMIDEANGNNN